MRTPLFAILFLASVAGFGQADQGEEHAQSLFSTVKPDVTIVVREHKTTADDVEVTMLDPAYPPELLRAQVEAVGANLGASVRGVVVGKANIGLKPEHSFLKATFSTDGLIDRAAGVFRVEPILKAFAAAPEQFRIEGFTIIFDGEKATTQTPKIYELPGVVQAQARVSDTPPGVEYRIRLLSQDPSKIEFPERAELALENAQTRQEPARDNRILLIVLFGVAALAIGALVYLLLLRAGRRAPV